MKYLKIFLLIAGVVIIIVNTLTLVYGKSDTPFNEMVTSSFFLFRQTLSLIAAFSLLISVIYMNFKNKDKKSIHVISFIFCILGNILLFTHEWTQIFFVRALGIYNPKTLLAIESSDNLTYFDISALSALGFFVLGWILFLLFNAYISKVSKYSKWLIITGFFLSPFLSSIMNELTAALFGSLVIGSGFIKLYFDFIKLDNQNNN